ncbi:vacuolar sorting 9 (vps9 domain) protein [Cystoisospora suis]|uniref:Vacuolar sorting 9 (Vps9 domain) protein n=1 Tax=Cystoisospora suis TaxID=483139 RepID=A0A2C6KCQ5_9APIC|nr:vacuolar sorting 9 (vps9 domain) protein [Cystoisospora suis]
MTVLGSHVFLQHLLHRQNRLLKAAAKASTFSTASSKGGGGDATSGSVLLLLPTEESLRGFNIADPFLSETHVCNATAIPSQYLNRRGQGLHREGQSILSDFGFSSPVSARILGEDIIYDEGVTYTCLLISRPLLLSPSSSSSLSSSGSTEKTSVSSSSSATTTATSRLSSSSSLPGQSHPPLYLVGFHPSGGREKSRLDASEKSIEEERDEIWALESQILHVADQWWHRGGRDPKTGVSGGEEVRREVEEEISFFKKTYIFALGCDDEVASRLNRLIHACLDRIKPLVTSSSSSSSSSRSSSSSFLGGRGESFLSSSSSSSSSSTADRFGKHQQASESSKEAASSLQQLSSHVERCASFSGRKLESFRGHINSCIFEKLHVKSLLRGVSVHRAATLFDEISVVKLPEQKSLILGLVVRSIQSSCCRHVSAQLHAKKRQGGRKDVKKRFVNSDGEGEEEEGRARERSLHVQQSQPVEISVDDLVGLVLAAVVMNGGKFILANLWYMTIFNFMKPRENQYAESGFYLTTLHSALSFAFFAPPSVSTGEVEERRGR